MRARTSCTSRGSDGHRLHDQATPELPPCFLQHLRTPMASRHSLHPTRNHPSPRRRVADSIPWKSSLRLPPRSPTATYNMIVDLTVSSDEEAADAGAEALSPPQARRAQPGTCERGGWSTRTKKTRWLRVGEGIGACELRVLLRAAARLRLRLRRVCGTVTATRG